MANNELEVSDALWKTFTDDQKIRHIHDNLVNLRKEVNAASPPCKFLETRVHNLEKSKKWKYLYAFLGGLTGGLISGQGGKHLP